MGSMGGGAGGTGGYSSSTYRPTMGYGASPYGMSGGYRGGNQYSHDHSPVGSKSDSSSSSISGGPIDSFPEQGRPMVLSSNPEEEDAMSIENLNGYHYYPSPLYEAGLSPPAKNEAQSVGTGRVKEEGALFGGSTLLTGGLGRFQGVDTSRGYYASDVY
jgi:meiosis-specific transcription factor NDT80